MTGDLRALPKAHLHLHLEGAMRPATLAEVAAGYGIPVPATRGFGSFTAFVSLYRAAAATLRTEADLRRVMREVVEDAATDGAVWVEPQTNPHRHPDIGSPAHVTDVLLDEAQRAGADVGIGVALVLSADRTQDPALARELAQIAADRVERPGVRVVGFGLAGDEVLGPPEDFTGAFDIAREAGLMSVPHAGELVGPASVRGALDALGAVRLAHGVRVVEDAELLARVVAEGVVLDVCPTSNLALSVVPSLAEHPLPQLLDAGARCTLNADDPLLFGPGLLAEYVLAREVLGLDDAALAACARTSLEASGAPPALVQAGLEGVARWSAPSPPR